MWICETWTKWFKLINSTTGQSNCEKSKDTSCSKLICKKMFDEILEKYYVRMCTEA